MPRGDGTGPAGMGPITGRAAGFCAGYPVPGFMNPVSGRGYWGWGRGGGRGRGLGRGFRWARAGFGYPARASAVASHPFYHGPVAPIVAPEQELAGLKEQAQYLQSALDEISKRIEELEKAKPEE